MDIAALFMNISILHFIFFNLLINIVIIYPLFIIMIDLNESITLKKNNRKQIMSEIDLTISILFKTTINGLFSSFETHLYNDGQK